MWSLLLQKKDLCDASHVHVFFLSFFPFDQQMNRIDSLMRERSLMEEEIRDIYDKRESVAQWEAQISEIIKW